MFKWLISAPMITTNSCFNEMASYSSTVRQTNHQPYFILSIADLLHDCDVSIHYPHIPTWVSYRSCLQDLGCYLSSSHLLLLHPWSSSSTYQSCTQPYRTWTLVPRPIVRISHCSAPPNHSILPKTVESHLKFTSSTCLAEKNAVKEWNS